MTAEADFFEKNARWFPRGVYPDDDDDDKIALIVTDEFPVEVRPCSMASLAPTQITADRSDYKQDS